MQCICMVTYDDCNGNFAYSQDDTGSAIWSSDNTGVASLDSVTKGLVRAHKAGTAHVSVGYTGSIYYWNGATCSSTSSTVQNSYLLNGSNSGCPDHLEVISDVTAYLKCPVLVPDRTVAYQVDDANGVPLSNVSTKEAVSPDPPTNACNTGNPFHPSCVAHANGQFDDVLTVNCNTVGGTCGFTYGSSKSSLSSAACRANGR